MKVFSYLIYGWKGVEKHMAELFVKDYEMVFPERVQYTYNAKNEYEPCLNMIQETYNKNMGNGIIFLKSASANYQEMEQYFKRIARKFQSIQMDEKKLSGMPVIENTRIPVSLIVACFKDEMTISEICEEYNLTEREVGEAMEYVIEILDIPYQEGFE